MSIGIARTADSGEPNVPLIRLIVARGVELEAARGGIDAVGPPGRTRAIRVAPAGEVVERGRTPEDERADADQRPDLVESWVDRWTTYPGEAVYREISS